MTFHTQTQPPIQDREPRCWRCGRKMAMILTRPWYIKCAKCAADNRSEPTIGGIEYRSVG